MLRTGKAVLLPIFAFAVCALSGAAYGQGTVVTTSQTVNYNTGTVNATGTPPITSFDFLRNMSLGFNKFDPALGTLQSVKVQVLATATLNSTITDTRTSGRGTTYTPGFSSDVNVKDTFGVLADTGTKTWTFTPIVLGPSTSQATGSSVQTPAPADSGQQPYSDAGTLTEFTGSGTISLLVDGTQGASVSPNSTATASLINGAVSGSVVVAYTYLATPEPGVIPALAAGGIAGLALLRRRRSLSRP